MCECVKEKNILFYKFENHKRNKYKVSHTHTLVLYMSKTLCNVWMCERKNKLFHKFENHKRNKYKVSHIHMFIFTYGQQPT